MHACCGWKEQDNTLCARMCSTVCKLCSPLAVAPVMILNKTHDVCCPHPLHLHPNAANGTWYWDDGTAPSFGLAAGYSNWPWDVGEPNDATPGENRVVRSRRAEGLWARREGSLLGTGPVCNAKGQGHACGSGSSVTSAPVPWC